MARAHARPVVGLQASFLIAASTVTACGPTINSSAPQHSVHQIVVLTDPPGARVVFNFDTLQQTTPLTIHRSRWRVGTIVNPILIRAIPNAAGQCTQTLSVPHDKPAPDTVTFSMSRCPQVDQDFSRIFNVDEVEELPERIRGPMPVYPEGMLAPGLEVEILVEVVIDTMGRPDPRSLHVLAAGDPRFIPSANDVVLASTFNPGSLLNRKVATRITIPVVYTARH
jgi:hypothetical protein